MAGDEQNDAGVAVVWAGTVECAPQIVTGPRASGADIGMAVVAIDSPCLNGSVGVAIFTGAANMVHDAVFPLLPTFAHFAGDFAQCIFPADAFPFAFAPFADPFERVKDAFGVVDLIVGGGSFGTVATATARVNGIAFKLGRTCGKLNMYLRKRASLETG